MTKQYVINYTIVVPEDFDTNKFEDDLVDLVMAHNGDVGFGEVNEESKDETCEDEKFSMTALYRDFLSWIRGEK